MRPELEVLLNHLTKRAINHALPDDKAVTEVFLSIKHGNGLRRDYQLTEIEGEWTLAYGGDRE